ncbi:hypothetical protein CQ018_12430 [Arthrobacter sp. MYb227]|nr:hypothetical protein CQ018_12430 [Arthrobacter sp. MYb227]
MFRRLLWVPSLQLGADRNRVEKILRDRSLRVEPDSIDIYAITSFKKPIGENLNDHERAYRKRT